MLKRNFFAILDAAFPAKDRIHALLERYNRMRLFRKQRTEGPLKFIVWRMVKL